MKNNRVRRFSKSLISASIRGLAIFAVFGLALYAYAVTYPAADPNPVSGVVGLYVGQTSGSFDGNSGGYAAVNNNCSIEHPGSHVCSPMEIINTYNHEPTFLPAPGSGTILWVNTGPPAYTGAAPNDCRGWQANAPSAEEQFFGTSWSFDIGRGSATFCTVAQPLACCK